MPIRLTDFEERLLRYLTERKTPSTVKQLSKYFIRSDSNINKSLKTLIDRGLIDIVMMGPKKFYKGK